MIRERNTNENKAEEPDYLKFMFSEIYVRDHLLIQWLIENIHKYIDNVTGKQRIEIEDIYKDWIKWRTEKEEAHG